jgi:hypothetical protein
MDVGVEVLFNKKIYEIIHMYEAGFIEIKEKGKENSMPILLVSKTGIEVCSNKSSFHTIESAKGILWVNRLAIKIFIAI